MRSIYEKLLSRRQFLQAMTVFLCSCATKPVSGVTPTPEIVHFSGEKARNATLPFLCFWQMAPNLQKTAFYMIIDRVA
jgi:hypothetical protein